MLCLYVIEPSLWAQPDAALQHYHFVQESLHDLAQAPQRRGATPQVAVGEVVDVLARLHALAPSTPWWRMRKRATPTPTPATRPGRWCRAGVVWREWPQHGVVRRLRSRDDEWHQHRQAFMHTPVVPAPAAGAL